MPKLHSPVYRQVLRQAWTITIKNKQLWILGFFATFLSNVGVYDILLRGIQGSVNRGALQTLFVTGDPLALSVVSIPLTLWQIGSKLVFVIPVAIIAAALITLFISFAVISQGGIMFACAKTAKGMKFDFKDALRAGVANFWPLLSTNIVSKVLASLLLCGIGYPVFLVLSHSGTLPLLLYFALFLILVPAALAVSFLGLFTGAGLITKKLSLSDALKTAWTQFSTHWLVSLEMAFIILALGFLVTVGIILAVLILSVPFIVLAVVAGSFAGSTGASFVFLVAFAVLLFTAIVIGSAFTTFQLSAWTLLYLRFVEKGAVAKIIRFFAALPGYTATKKR